MSALSIYVHVPFCAKHCAYCDFNTYVEQRTSAIVNATVNALCADIERSSRAMFDDAPLNSRPVETIFFGGGTPTFLTGDQLTRVLEAVRANFDVATDAEISSEANPGSSDAEKFGAMRAAGFNRLSIGVQALNDPLLTALDRFHTVADAESAIRLAREAGFENLSLDLMFRLPRQTRALWRESLEHAIELQPDHLSLYALTLEPGTRFERLSKGGKLPLPDEDAEAAMYEECIDQLESAGFAQYEVSNFAKPGFRCRHNLVYWRNEEHLGVGPGAVSYIGGRRWKRERLPRRYVNKVAANADLAVESECLSLTAALGETIMVGLRLRDGVDLDELTDRFGIDVARRYETTIKRFVGAGMIDMTGELVRLTRAGLMVADTIVAEFLDIEST